MHNPSRFFPLPTTIGEIFRTVSATQPGDNSFTGLALIQQTRHTKEVLSSHFHATLLLTRPGPASFALWSTSPQDGCTTFVWWREHVIVVGPFLATFCGWMDGRLGLRCLRCSYISRLHCQLPQRIWLTWWLLI